MSRSRKHRESSTRRDFLRASAAAIAAGAFVGGCAAPQRRGFRPPVVPEEAARDLPLRVGVIGCGGRGTGAAINCIDAGPNIRVVALADLFSDRVESSRRTLLEQRGEHCDLPDARCFAGFDAYREVCALDDVNLVILAAPPGFRPPHLAAAIEAGKHVFTEKPVAVDPVGARRVITAAEAAEARGLSIVAGTQRRHQPHYLDALARIHAGDVGRPVAAQCYWNQGDLWVKHKDADWSDMEWQCRNWLYFCWLSGDHIVEQHVHNIDVINWAMGGPPVKAVGMGGRQVRTQPEFGDVYDHFSVEYEYANGARVLSMCRQIKGTSSRVSERIVGTRGTVDLNHNGATIAGPYDWTFDDGGNPVNPYEQEHRNLVAAIRLGNPLNEGRQVAESTLTAIMGRMSAYTGRELQWDWIRNASQLDLSPTAYKFGDLPVGEVPMPGITRLT